MPFSRRCFAVDLFVSFLATILLLLLSFWAGRNARTWPTASPSTQIPSSNPANTIKEGVCLNSNAQPRCATGSHPVQIQHLLVDVDNVDKLKLQSNNFIEGILSQKLFNDMGTSTLSSDCHWTGTEQVRCFRVLPEARMSLYAWPSKGVLMLDIFTNSADPLIHIIPKLDQLFGTQIQPATGRCLGDDVAPPPRMKWSYKKRRGAHNAGGTQIDRLLGNMEWQKVAVASTGSSIGRLDVWDVVANNRNPDQVPDRVAFLNGAILSRKFGEAAYYDALVHPAMLSFEDPARVAIIGGHTGAALREVLRHYTVEKVLLIGVDKEMEDACREYLPDWNDCSDLVGSASSCFDDPRVEIVYKDAVSWFAGVDAEIVFDVIIVDTLQPEVSLDHLLYKDKIMPLSLYGSLSEMGVLSVSVGRTRVTDHPLEADQTVLELFLNKMEDAGFLSLQIYSEAFSVDLRDPWSFAVFMKDSWSRAHWFSTSEAAMTLEINDEAANTKTGAFSFKYFDGGTMMQYRFSSRIHEEIYCRRNPKPSECKGHGYDPSPENFPASSFYVKQSEVREKSGRGVFAKERVPKGNYILLDECVHDMFVSPWTAAILTYFVEETGLPYWITLQTGYLHGYGYSNYDFGMESVEVDLGIGNFVNHGCNGTYNIGIPLNATEQDAELGRGAEAYGYDNNLRLYDPYSLRHYPMSQCVEGLTTLRDIDIGEEVLDNYMVHYGSLASEWDTSLSELKGWCSGGPSSIGTITEYEESHSI